MRTIGIFCLVALLLFLAWHFDILLQLEGTAGLDRKPGWDAPRELSLTTGSHTSALQNVPITGSVTQSCSASCARDSRSLRIGPAQMSS